MTFFLGTKGSVKLRRGSDPVLGSLTASIGVDDIHLVLNRIGFEGAIDNVLTGDRVDLVTTDARNLDFIPSANWSTNQTEDTFSAYVNINAAGGLRLYPTFNDAVNNNRDNEIALEAFSGDPIEVRLEVRDISYNLLGNVTRYEFQNDRQQIDTTTLSDKYRQQYSAGIISGAGRIDCAFDSTASGTSENPKLLISLIQRLDLGCAFDMALYLTDKDVDPNVENLFYLLTAVITSSGVNVAAGEIIDCSIDFVTTGEVRLVTGVPSQYILKEDTDRIQVEQTLDFLLQEDTD